MVVASSLRIPLVPSPPPKRNRDMHVWRASFRTLLLRTVVGLALAIVSLAVLSPAANAEITSDPKNSWGVADLDGSTTTNWNSYVWAIEQIGNTIYVGGKFESVRGGGTNFSQPYLAAFHADTGEWISWWRPQLNGSVYALQRSSDGSKLYVGGEFTSVNGQGVNAFAALNPANGNLVSGYTTRVSGGGPAVVRNFDLHAGQLYLSGAFKNIARSGVRQDAYNVARINDSNGSIDSNWKPRVDGGGVWGVSASRTTSRVYLAGLFNQVNSNGDAGFAVVNSTNGADASGGWELENNNCNNDTAQGSCESYHDVAATSTGLIFVGGLEHGLYVLNESDFSLRWFHYTADPNANWFGGDFQDIEVVGNRVYASCHCWGYHWQNRNLFRHRSPTGTRTSVRSVAAYNISTGERITSFSPVMSGVAGAWAIHGHSTDGCLWVGGQMTRAGSTGVDHLVRLCDNGTPGPAAGPRLTPGGGGGDGNAAPVKVISCWATRTATGVRVTWTRANNDNAEKFVVERRRNGGQWFWNGAANAPATAVNATLTNTGNYQYRLITRNGNQSSTAHNCGPDGGVNW